ncbi:MAG: Uncharacterised protein [Bacteroidetes bacterium MED-G17]|nr:MAG: Uncharacterised protein [Bacteroidetes bacterium MED-G17]
MSGTHKKTRSAAHKSKSKIFFAWLPTSKANFFALSTFLEDMPTMGWPNREKFFAKCQATFPEPINAILTFCISHILHTFHQRYTKANSHYYGPQPKQINPWENNGFHNDIIRLCRPFSGIQNNVHVATILRIQPESK